MISSLSFNFMSYKPCFKGEVTKVGSHAATGQINVKDDTPQNVRDLMMDIRKKSLKGIPVEEETAQLEKHMLASDDIQLKASIYECLIKYGTDKYVRK